MKKTIMCILGIMAVLFFLSCGQEEESSNVVLDTQNEEPVKVLLYLHGLLGDLSFFDSAARGMTFIEEKYGDRVDIKIVEAGLDNTKWEPAFLDEADRGFDVIFLGTWSMVDTIQTYAADYPETAFIFYDESIDFSTGDYPNVFCLTYAQNEGSFLAGALAAEMSESGIVSFLGGAVNVVINDFLVGYIEGAQYINPDIQVLVSFIGNFEDSAAGKELALAQYQNGSDVGFNVAGGGGLGQIDAAYETGNLAIGVDSDQALLFAESSPEKAEVIMTSMLKNVDVSLALAFDQYMEGVLPFGTMEVFGVAADTVGLAKNQYYENIVPEDTREKIEEIRNSIIAGEISVTSSFGLTGQEVEAIINSAQ